MVTNVKRTGRTNNSCELNFIVLYVGAPDGSSGVIAGFPKDETLKTTKKRVIFEEPDPNESERNPRPKGGSLRDNFPGNVDLTIEDERNQNEVRLRCLSCEDSCDEKYVSACFNASKVSGNLF